MTVTGMGKLATVGDPHSIGEALVEVIRNRQKYICPREQIEKTFSFQETVDSYEAIFEQYAKK